MVVLLEGSSLLGREAHQFPGVRITVSVFHVAWHSCLGRRFRFGLPSCLDASRAFPLRPRCPFVVSAANRP